MVAILIGGLIRRTVEGGRRSSGSLRSSRENPLGPSSIFLSPRVVDALGATSLSRVPSPEPPQRRKLAARAAMNAHCLDVVREIRASEFFSN
jgi:hypothetical protein